MDNTELLAFIRRNRSKIIAQIKPIRDGLNNSPLAMERAGIYSKLGPLDDERAEVVRKIDSLVTRLVHAERLTGTDAALRREALRDQIKNLGIKQTRLDVSMRSPKDRMYKLNEEITQLEKNTLRSIILKTAENSVRFENVEGILSDIIIFINHKKPVDDTNLQLVMLFKNDSELSSLLSKPLQNQLENLSDQSEYYASIYHPHWRKFDEASKDAVARGYKEAPVVAPPVQDPVDEIMKEFDTIIRQSRTASNSWSFHGLFSRFMSQSSTENPNAKIAKLKKRVYNLALDTRDVKTFFNTHEKALSRLLNYDHRSGFHFDRPDSARLIEKLRDPNASERFREVSVEKAIESVTGQRYSAPPSRFRNQ